MTGDDLTAILITVCIIEAVILIGAGIQVLLDKQDIRQLKTNQQIDMMRHMLKG